MSKSQDKYLGTKYDTVPYFSRTVATVHLRLAITMVVPLVLCPCLRAQMLQSWFGGTVDVVYLGL